MDLNSIDVNGTQAQVTIEESLQLAVEFGDGKSLIAALELIGYNPTIILNLQALTEQVRLKYDIPETETGFLYQCFMMPLVALIRVDKRMAQLEKLQKDVDPQNN